MTRRIFSRRVKCWFLLTCLLRGMTQDSPPRAHMHSVSTHMPLARHDSAVYGEVQNKLVSTHMPLARHDEVAS